MKKASEVPRLLLFFLQIALMGIAERNSLMYIEISAGIYIA